MRQPIGTRVLVALFGSGSIAFLWLEFRQPFLPPTLQIALEGAFVLFTMGAWIVQPAAESRKPLGAFVDTVNTFTWAIFMARHIYPLIDKGMSGR